MKKLSVTVFTFLLILLPLSAKVITVDNNPGSVAMYTSLQTAVNDAEAGDTILIAASPSDYGTTFSVYKEVHLVGAGYLLAENGIPGLSSNRTAAHPQFKQDNSIGDSSNSSCKGITGSINSDPTVSGLVIDKCHSPSWNWRFQGQTTVTGCLTPHQIRLDASTSSISNSIVGNIYLGVANTIATNCVVTTAINTVPSSSISNCIFTFTNANSFDDDGSFSYCMTIGTSFLEEGSGNINNQFIADVFAQIGSINNDAYWQLKEVGSTAAGEGFGGDDMGAYGGSGSLCTVGCSWSPTADAPNGAFDCNRSYRADFRGRIRSIR